MMENDEVRYYYLKRRVSGGSMPFGCVAFRKNEDGTVNRGVSLCSTRDNFNKMHARGLAMKRLLDAEKAGLDTYFGEYGNCAGYRQNPLACQGMSDEFDFLYDRSVEQYSSGSLGCSPTAQEMNIMGIAGRK